MLIVSPQHRWTISLVVVMVAATAGATIARRFDLDSKIQACVKSNSGVIRIVTAPSDCKDNETALAWNVSGPKGDAGPAGPAGPPGPQGAPGASACPFDSPLPPCSVGGGHGFLKIQGVEGESQAPNHQHEIEIQYLRFGAATPTTQTGAGGTHATGRLQFDHFVIGKHVDRASEPLVDALVRGTVLQRAILKLQSDDGRNQSDFLTLELDDAQIIGSHTTWKGGEPVEELELMFTQVKSTYLSPDGHTIQACWTRDQRGRNAC